MNTSPAKPPEQPGLLGRLDRTGLPLLVARLALGLMFIWMGLAKTGYPELALKKTGLWDRPAFADLRETGVLHVAGPVKIELGGPVQFFKLIREYEMFPPRAWRLLNFTVVVMPWVEVLCGVLLVLGIGVRGAAGLLLALLVMFTSMIILRGIHEQHARQIAFCAIQFNCGCGAGVVWICHKIPENLALILFAAVCLLSRSDRFCLARNLVGRRTR
jgi:uncharacterized membrane protein YphA (DoxX/SURF4 family)